MRKTLFVLSVLLMSIAVAGCQSTVQAEAAPVEVEPTPESDPLVFTFDGEICTYEGPTTIQAGLIPIKFINESGEAARVGGLLLDEGKTWDDLLVYNEENGPEAPPPDWTTKEIGTSAVLGGNKSEGSVRFKPGEYGMFCTTISPPAGWPGTPLTVEE